jgi:hypothetical protein
MIDHEIVASRVLPTIDISGRKSKIITLVGKPTESDGVWKCEYEIIIDELHNKRFSFGANSLQALFLALDGMQAEVIGLARRYDLQVEWDGSKFKMPRRLKSIWESD